VKGYRIWSLSETKVILRRNVVFDENFVFNPTLKFNILEDCGIEKQMEQRETEATCEADEDSPQSHSEEEASVVPLASWENQSITLNHPKRSNFWVPPKRYVYEDMVSYALLVTEEVDPHEPSTFEVNKVGTTDNPADMFTKLVPQSRLVWNSV
jgi:hypothetical protein